MSEENHRIWGTSLPIIIITGKLFNDTVLR